MIRYTTGVSFSGISGTGANDAASVIEFLNVLVQEAIDEYFIQELEEPEIELPKFPIVRKINANTKIVPARITARARSNP